MRSNSLLIISLILTLIASLAAQSALAQRAGASGEMPPLPVKKSSVIKKEPVDQRIERVEIKGLVRFTRQTVIGYLPFKIGDTIEAEEVEKAVLLTKYNLVKMSLLFFNAEVEINDGVVYIEVKEKPTIYNVYVEGNAAIETKELQPIFAANLISTRQLFTRQNAYTVIENIKALYAIREPELTPFIYYEVKRLRDNLVDVTFIVDEGRVQLRND